MTCGVAKHKHKVPLSEHNVAIGWSLSERNGATSLVRVFEYIYYQHNIQSQWDFHTSLILCSMIHHRLSNLESQLYMQSNAGCKQRNGIASYDLIQNV